MTDSNSTTLRNSLAAAVKSYVKANGWTNKDAAEKGDVVYGRMCNILSGKIEHISVDALVNVLGAYGYQLSVTSSDSTVEIVLEKIQVEVGGVLYDVDDPAIQFKKPADFDPDFDRVLTDE